MTMKRMLSKLLVTAAGVSLIAGSLSPVTTSANTILNSNEKRIVATQSTLKQQDESYISEQNLIIKYTKPLTGAEHRKAGGTVIKNIPSLSYSIVTVKNKKNLQKAIAAYQKIGHVKSVTPSIQYRTFAVSDPKVNQQYFVKQLRLEESQKLAGKNPVTVAVIDQGVDTKHPDLKDRILPGYNAVNPMNQASPDFHGTHVAGIIAANKNNNVGGYGVNPNVNILAIDVFDRQFFASDYSIAQGILHAVEKGAKVINLSLGGPIRSPILEEAVNQALEKNVVIVAAAGNTGDASAEYPAAYEGVISVGSVNEEKKLSNFSTYGSSIDLVAPGENIYSTYYDYEKKSTYLELSGTSMAAPIVSGTASLLLSKYPQLTPTQVEYILENSAQDLGAKGFDTKFGNGLVDPVKALQFNIKNLPQTTKTIWDGEKIKATAQKVDTSKKNALKHNITMPFEEKWYSTEVKEGEHVQFELEGASQFDYKLMLYMETPDGEERVDINKVLEGQREGKLFQIPFAGTLFFGVKDVNGSYDQSAQKQSHYTLSVQTHTNLPEDESTVEKPIEIQLPYSSLGKNYTLIGSEGDDDYFTFTVDKEQVVKADLSAIPGSDTNISVYNLNMLIPEEAPEEESAEKAPSLTEEEIQAMINELFQGDEPLEPMYFANKGSVSEGESLTFTANPEEKYLLKVSNKQDENSYFDTIDFLFNGNLLDGTPPEPQSSAIPYQLTMEGKVLPEDEDGIPYLMLEGEEGQTEENDYFQMVQDGALHYGIGEKGKGYLQSLEDEDWYRVTPDETGIYEMKFSGMQATELPMMEIYQLVDEDKNKQQGMIFSEGVEEEPGETEQPIDEEPIDSEEPEENSPSLQMIGSNLDEMGMVKDSLNTGLKADETYYLRVAPNYFRGNISFDPYQFETKLIVSNPQDAYEDNDRLENIKDLPGTVIKGNFAMPNDVDAFYYEAKADGIQGVSIQPQAVDSVEKAKYPAELFGNYYGFVTILEDMNKNRNVDEEEYDTARHIFKFHASGMTTGSFQTEKGKNYIILTSAFFENLLPLSLTPYELKMEQVNTNDEDKDSVVKNNIPSKPLKLNEKSKGLFEATGFLNAGVPYGDQDWYEWKVTKETKGQISLTTGPEIDGVISIYKNGELVTKADQYATGDQEILAIHLKKGTYHIKIEDTFNNASLTPYTIKITSSN